jgi:hypothetical protein
MSLVEFLEARLAEDELTAKAAIDGTADWHALYTYRDVKDSDGHTSCWPTADIPQSGRPHTSPGTAPPVCWPTTDIPQSGRPHTSPGTALPASCASARPPARSSPTSFISMRSATPRAEAPRRRL